MNGRQHSFQPWLAGDPNPDPVSLPIWHRDGIPWHRVAPPPARHDHWPQTVGTVPEAVYRCGCAAYGGPGEPWVLVGPARVEGGVR